MDFSKPLLYHVAEVHLETGLWLGLHSCLLPLREAVSPAQVRMCPVCLPYAPDSDIPLPNSADEIEQIWVFPGPTRLFNHRIIEWFGFNVRFCVV